jgi:GT2 family glycosyltransferase
MVLSNKEIKASIVIPTRNRRDDLVRAIRSIRAQTVAVEVLVMDDGSTDGTVEFLAQNFPEVAVFQLGSGRGPAFQRNRGIELAKQNIVFAIDDDSEFASPYTIEQTLAEFELPRIAAVAVPFINVRQNPYVHQRAPSSDDVYVVSAFVGAAHAVRRDVFLSIGGYREHFFYMGEEGDLCARMLNAGYVTRLGRADPIHHHESPVRNTHFADRCGRRNDILFAWHNAPLGWLPMHIAATIFNGLRFGFRARRPGQRLLDSQAAFGPVLSNGMSAYRSPRWRTSYSGS